MNSSDINSLGLILDILGALLLWYFVAEINFAVKGEYLKGNAEIALVDPTPEEITAFKRRIFLTRVGVILVVLGFILQLVSNYAGQ